MACFIFKTPDIHEIQFYIPYTDDIRDKPVNYQYIEIELLKRVPWINDCLCFFCCGTYPVWYIPSFLLLCSQSPQ